MTDPDLSDSCVLIVDDEPSNVLLLETLLRREGLGRVVGVTDPAEALERFVTVGPDLGLLDLMMPGIDGYELLDAIRRQTAADRFQPVIVLTADRTPAARHRALALGANDFLTKPLDLVEVMLRVTNLLETVTLYRRLEARP